jgi:hypothetical protein
MIHISLSNATPLWVVAISLAGTLLICLILSLSRLVRSVFPQTAAGRLEWWKSFWKYRRDLRRDRWKRREIRRAERKLGRANDFDRPQREPTQEEQSRNSISGVPTSRQRQDRQTDALRQLQTELERQAGNGGKDSAQQAFPHQAQFDSQVPDLASQRCSLQEGHHKGITLFQDDDSGFYDWMESHPDAYFINIIRNSKATFLVLHRSGCPRFTRNPARHQAKDHVKFCSTDRRNLEGLALQTTDCEATICPACLT